MKTFKRIISVLLIFAFVLTTPCLAFAGKKDKEDKTDRKMTYKDLVIDDTEAGQINANRNKKQPTGKNNIKKNKAYSQTGEWLTNDGADVEALALASSYSSYTAGKIGSVKNQSPYGTCWAFSSTSSCEASLYAALKAAGSTASVEDLSELQLAYFFYHEQIDPLGNMTGDSTKNVDDTILDEGGNHLFTMWGLASWVNGAKETTLPYTTSRCKDALNGKIDNNLAYAADIAHLQNAYIIPWKNDATSKNNIKQAIVDYGQVSCSYYHNDSNYNSTYGSYYTSKESSNHAVSIVGWNDDYPSSYFSTKPAGNGAWLIKNSWGTGWGTDGDANATNSGSGGFFWLSYYDKSLLYNGEVYVFDFDTKENYQYNYQYDGSCGLKYKSISTGTKVAAIYDIKGLTSDAETIKAVGIGISDTNVSGTVSIYTGVTDNKPLSGTKVTSQTFETYYDGFYTIDLDNPVTLEKGTKFSVVFEFDSYTYVYIDYSYTNGGWIQFTANTKNDKTYTISSSGTVTNLNSSSQTGRIKAYTVDAELNPDGPFDIKFYDGETLKASYEKTKGTDITITTPALSKDGYELLGWTLTSGSTTKYCDANATFTYSQDADLTLYAIWYRTSPYLITFINDTTTVQTVAKNEGEPATFTTPILYKAQNRFDGWTTTKGSKTIVYKPGVEVTYTSNQDLTLYAVWTSAVRVLFKDGDDIVNIQYKTGKNKLSVVCPTYSKPGYVFLGWSATQNAKTATYTAGKKFDFRGNTDTTYYAVWKTPTTYTITLKNGSNTIYTTTKLEGATVTVDLPRLVKEGYEFLGWAKSATATAKEYDPESTLTYSADANLTLYAVWREEGMPDEPTAPTLTVKITKVTNKKKTEYRYTLTSSEFGAKIQYNTGKSWITGTTFTNKNGSLAFSVRVTVNGTVYNYSCRGNVVTLK